MSARFHWPRAIVPVVAVILLGLVAGGGGWPSPAEETRSRPTQHSATGTDGWSERPPRERPPSTSAVERTAGAPAPFDPDDFLPPVSLPTSPPLAVAGEVVSGPPVLENAGGIVVHARLAPFIRTLLAEAEVAGIPLEGGGHRDAAKQRRLRAQNCPDPVSSPPSGCSPPTARVGESLHQAGLAIDFTSGGELIRDRNSPAYGFIEANADWMGLRVHPEEPWHWSFRP